MISGARLRLLKDLKDFNSQNDSSMVTRVIEDNLFKW
jgi:hypothetical protein